MLTPVQQKAKSGLCPECELGELYEEQNETEIVLKCSNCSITMDSDGGITF